MRPTLHVPLEEARTRLHDIVRQGESLRQESAEVQQLLDDADIEARRDFAAQTRLLVERQPESWIDTKRGWAMRSLNTLQTIFSIPSPQVSAFRLISAMPAASTHTSRGAFSAERSDLDRGLAVLRKVQAELAPPARKTTVFLVHGRDTAKRASLMNLLEAYGLKVLGWGDQAELTGRGAPSTLEIVQAGMAAADAVVVLLTADDLARVKPEFARSDDGPDELELTGQPRLNVVFEAGMALAIDRDRVVIVSMGSTRQVTNMDGINAVVLVPGDDASALELRQRLRTAGLDVLIDRS